jgi:hypothetical protein
MRLLTPRHLRTLHKVLSRVDPYSNVVAASVLQGGETAADLLFHILTNAGTAADHVILLLTAPAPHTQRQPPCSNLSTLRRPTLYISLYSPLSMIPGVVPLYL